MTKNEYEDLKTPQQRLGAFISKTYRVKSDFAADMGIHRQDVSKYTGNGSSEFESEEKLIKLRKLGLNTNWYKTGEGEMLLPEINSKHIGVPFYNIDVTASIVSTFNDIQEQPEYYINFKPLNDCTAYFMVFGDSMYPRYASGEIVAVKQVNNYDVILWGESYLVITSDDSNGLRTIKLLYPHPTDEDKIVLRSSNPNFSGDTIIKKENIVGLYIVKGKITRNLL